jgi:integrase
VDASAERWLRYTGHDRGPLRAGSCLRSFPFATSSSESVLGKKRRPPSSTVPRPAPRRRPRNTKYTARRVQQIVKSYAEQAGVKATPHSFRHQAITWLTRHSGLADAELQLIIGHARRETLAIYQHWPTDDKGLSGSLPLTHRL